MPDLSHFDASGGQPNGRNRPASPIRPEKREPPPLSECGPETLALIRDRRRWRKGDVFEVARLAGIMAAKRTSDLIPLCHPLPITGVTIDLTATDRTPCESRPR